MRIARIGLAGFAFGVLLLIASREPAGAEQFVGVSSNQATFIAWTADASGHIQGQMQIARLEPSANGAEIKNKNGAFSGTRSGSDISIAFGTFSAIVGTWTGRLGFNSLTLDYPSSDGGLGEIVLHSGSLSDFRRAAQQLSSTAANAQQVQSLASIGKATANQIAETEKALTDAEGRLEAVFPVQAQTNNPNSLSVKYSDFLSAMQAAYASELFDAQTRPMNCQLRNRVQSEANAVQSVFNGIYPLEQLENNITNNSRRDINIINSSLQSLSELYPKLMAEADAYARLTNRQHVVVDYNKRLAAFRAQAQPILNRVGARLPPALMFYREKNQMSRDIMDKARDLPDTISC